MPTREYPKKIAYTTAIPFDNPTTKIANHTVSGPITFTKATTNQEPGYGAILRITADGVNVPNLTAFKKIGEGNYVNTNGTVNQLWFIYDGTDHCVCFTQPSTISSGGGGGDVTAPTLVSASIQNSAPNKIVLDYNEALNTGSTPSAGSFIVVVNGGPELTPSSVLVSGNSVIVTMGFNFEESNTNIRISYAPGAGPIEDTAGNNAASFSNQLVTNNVASADLPTANLVLHYEFTEGLTLAGSDVVTWDPIDSKGSQLVAEVGNEPQSAGSSGIVFAGEPLDGADTPLGDNLSIYVKCKATTLNKAILKFPGGFGFYIGSTNYQVGFSGTGYGVLSGVTNTLPSGFDIYAITKAGNIAKIYKNGIFVGDFTREPTPDSPLGSAIDFAGVIPAVDSFVGNLKAIVGYNVTHGATQVSAATNYLLTL